MTKALPGTTDRQKLVLTKCSPLGDPLYEIDEYEWGDRYDTAAGVYHLFSREVFSLLLGEEFVSQALVEKIMGWRHSGFSVHSKVKAFTKEEAERVGKYMVRPLLSLERLSFSEKEGKVCYWYGKEGEDRFSGSFAGRRGWP